VSGSYMYIAIKEGEPRAGFTTRSGLVRWMSERPWAGIRCFRIREHRADTIADITDRVLSDASALRSIQTY
jgi:hypothetical protein